MNEYRVVFYETPNGNIPVKEFLDGLDSRMRAKMVRSLAF